MTHEQLALVNQQLAGMLKSGIPLEGALERLCADMKTGRLRNELGLLVADLKAGRPLGEALGVRKLPEFYVRMLQLGARGQDLPGVLVLLGDYYQRSHLVWTRLSGLMVYPVLVLLTAAVLSAVVAVVLRVAFGALGSSGDLMGMGVERLRMEWQVRAWAPTAVCGVLALGAAAFLWVRPMRQWVRWTLPGFRDASLANLASSFHLMMSKGCALGDAIGLATGLEAGSPAAADLEGWSRKLKAGEGRFPAMAEGGRCVPPLFVWLVAQGGEDMAGGFRRAAELYHRRAVHKIEMLLYLALPVSVLLLGMLVVLQVQPLVRLLMVQMDVLGSVE